LSVHFDYDWLIVNTVDNDTDDIFDFLEDRGVMGTNKHIYYADSTITDKDGDGLLDGKEFGELVVFANYNETTVTNSTISVSGYTPTTKGKFGVYVKLNSRPDNINWDQDNADDGVDETPMTTNEPINYILYFDDPSINGIYGNKECYELWFWKHDYIYESFEINTLDELDSFWGKMCHESSYSNRYNVTDSGFSDGFSYSKVHNLILIFHGDDKNDGLVLDNNLLVEEESFKETVDWYTNVEIDNVDVQACFAYINRDKDEYTVATILRDSDKIDSVYAGNGKMIYIWDYQLNCCFMGIYRLRKGCKDHYCGMFTTLLFWEC
jgi:hypothetical protein